MPGDDPYHPRVMVREEHTICLIGFDDEADAFELVPLARGFRISFPHAFAGQGIMAWAVYSYDIEGGRVRRNSLGVSFESGPGSTDSMPVTVYF